MKKILFGVLSLSLALCLGSSFVTNTYAENDTETADTATPAGTSISLQPSSETIQINSNSIYDKTFSFKNDGSSEIKIEVYAAPYSYIYSNEDDLYKLGFTNENNFTQISRWITIKDTAGNYVENPIYTVQPNETIEISYRITTPNNIPAGGQYAVIFARTISAATTTGIRTEASAGMIIYGHSLEGEAITSAEISDLTIAQGTRDAGSTKNNFYATAKVKNTGNVDFSAIGKLKVEPILGTGSYETSARGISVIPESERIVEDEWKDTPSFGVYKVTWTVTAADKTEETEKVIFLVPVWAIVLSIILLTIIIIWIIMGVRKRKDRRSRLAV